MDQVELVSKIFNLCIFPLLAILTAYAVQWIKMKMGELARRQENEIAAKYIAKLADTITACVEAVNQTYVDTLKKKGQFGIEEQKEAFQRVYNEVLEVLKGEAYDYLDSMYIDFDTYLKTLIEAQVRNSKIEINK